MKQRILLISLAVLALAACKRKQAVWESDWQLPLLKDTLTLEQFVGEEYLEVNGGYYELNIDRTVYEMDLSDIIEIPDTTIEYAYALSLSSVNVPPGMSIVNNEEEEYDMGLGEVELKKIRVKSGGIEITVKNPIGTKAFFTVELPGVTKNGATLTQQMVAPAGTLPNPGVVTDFVDLSGYEMDLRGPDYGSFNIIRSKMHVASDPNGPSVIVTNLDSVRFVFRMNDLKIDYARGYFGNELITDTTSEYIEALGKIVSGLIDLPASDLQLEVVNGLKVSAKVMLTQLKNTNAQGNTVSMTHPSMNSWVTINSATGNASALTESVTTLEFNAQNSNMEQFLENHGATNDIGFQLQLNPWGNVSGGWDEIFPQSRLKVNLRGNMPLNIGLTDLVMQDTFDFSFKQDFTKTHISEGTMWLRATNAFPMQAEVTMYLMDAAGNTIAAINSSQDVESSVYGTVINNILQQQSYVEFVIPDSAIDALESVSRLSVRVKMNTPNANTNASEQVQIPAGAFFGFKVGAKLKLENRL